MNLFEYFNDSSVKSIQRRYRLLLAEISEISFVATRT